MAWKYNKETLKNPPASMAACKTSQELTNFLVNHIGTQGKPLARKVLLENKSIFKLVELKDILLQKGGTKKATLRLDKSHEQEAIALYMISLRAPSKPGCKQCESHKSRGPFRDCIGNDEDKFGGACLCCKYSGTPTTCSFVADIAKRKEEEERQNQREAMISGETEWDFDSETLKLMTSRKIEELINKLQGELDDREKSSPVKRGRR